jgi:hypothetical protein
MQNKGGIMRKILILLFLFLNLSFAKDNILLSSASAFKIVMGQNPQTSVLVSKARAILIFPSVKKVGFVIGGMYGEGVALVKSGGGYNAFKAEITDGSLGFQIGYEDNYLVMFIMDEKLVQNMKKSEITLSADATATAVTASANIGTIDAFTRDMYVYVDKSGIFAGVSLGGSVVSINTGKTYNTNSHEYQILMSYVR